MERDFIKDAIRDALKDELVQRGLTGQPPAKSFLESKTFWGVALMLAPTAGRYLGMDVTPDDVQQSATHVTTIIEAGGALLALWGRKTAKADIRLG